MASIVPVLALLTTVFAASSVWSAATTTNYDCQGKPNDFYPDPTSCSSYYICANQNAFRITCERGLLYNAVSKNCDWAANVHCGLQTTIYHHPQPTTTSSPPHHRTQQPVTSQPSRTLPPANTAPPTTQPAPTAVTQQPSAAAPHGGFNCQGRPNDLYADPQSCSNYYICAQQNAFLVPCEPGLMYNPVVKHCDWPASVQCGAQHTALPVGQTTTRPQQLVTGSPSSQSPTTRAPQQGAGFSCQGKPNGQYSNPQSICNYYICDQQNAFLVDCKPGFLFNPVANKCDWSPGVNVCGAPATTTYPATVQPPHTSHPVTPAHTRPPYSPSTQPPQPTPSQGSTTAMFDCTGLADGFYPDPNSCESFYFCGYHVPFKATCVAGLLFNPTVRHCDFASNVQCGGATSAPKTQLPVVTNPPFTNPPFTNPPFTNPPFTNPPFTNHPFTNPPSVAPGNPCQASPSLLPHPSDCHQYIQCTRGLPFRLTCPNNLVFNPALGTCDFPSNVPQCLSG